MKAIVRARPPLTRALAWAAMAVGVIARVFSLVVRPLWADEIFTLTVARKSASEILAALRVDSGPPLHYLFAHVLLVPFGPAPGLPDVLVRVLSLVASLLHLPLLFVVARRLGRPEMGLPAAALYSVFPLAVAYAAEGRAYALASLLALLAFERALALRERPRLGTALGLTLAAAGAVLTHYLAVFPVAALAILALDARPAARHALVLSGLAATALAATWVPIALAQPHASMAWSREAGFASALRDFPANLAFGAPAGGTAMAALGVTGAVLLAALLAREWRGVLAPVARVLGLSLALLARLLDAPVRVGRRVLAAGYWGPELDYRLARAGAPGRVVLFPSAVAAHPGWYREEDLRDATLAAEAEAILSTPQAPTLFVLPRGSRASAAIASRLGRTRRLLSSPLVDVVETRSP